MAPLWLLVVGFFACHVTFEALNEALVTIPGVPKSGSAWHRATWPLMLFLKPGDG
jgi:hypothetical protein